MTEQSNNIILLSADALRADHLSCYGYDRETSPNLDALYNESLSFEHAHSASSHTREAIPALLTGEYPDRAVDDNYRLQAETIASKLSGHGYKTGGFHSNPYASRAFGFDDGFDKFYDDLYLGGNKFIALAQRALDLLLDRHYARAEKINRLSLSWLDSLDSDDTFFLWNHYMDTHGPYEPPAGFDSFQRHNSSNFDDPKSLYKRAVSEPESITDEEREHLIDSYDGEIRYLDHHIRDFLDALDSRNLLENTTVIFTSDHGDAFGERGYYGHPRYLDRELTHVPVIIRGGDKGSISDAVSTIDIVPTILSQLSLDHSERSGTPFIDDSSTAVGSKRTAIAQSRGEGEEADTRRFIIRSDTDQTSAIQNLKTGEVKYNDSTGSEGTLEDELSSHISQTTHGEPDILTSDQEDDEITDRLEALGYK